MFFGKREPFAVQSIEAHRRMGLRLDVLECPELQRRYPQIAWDGVEFGLFEPDLGALMARSAAGGGRLAGTEPRFSLASKGESQHREVH